MPLISSAIWMFEQQNNLIRQLARTLPKRPMLSSHTVSVCPPPPPNRPSPEPVTPPSLPDVHCFFFPPCFFSPAWCQPFIHSLTVGMKGGFLGRLGNGILWALSENLQIKRAGLMESNGGGERGCWGVGKEMFPLAVSQKTCKINMFEINNRNYCWPHSISLQFIYLLPALPVLLLWLYIYIHFTYKSVKVLLRKPSSSSSCHW